ncbi:MAG: hypothetical protein R3E79_55890 [Caldilineaceae bacterium]
MQCGAGSRYTSPMLVLVLTGALTLWAYRTDIKRLYLYTALVLAVYGSSFWLAVTFPTYLTAVGIGGAVDWARYDRFCAGTSKLSPSG